MDAEQSFTAHCVTSRRNEAAATTASCGTARVAKYPDDGGLQGRPPPLLFVLHRFCVYFLVSFISI